MLFKEFPMLYRLIVIVSLLLAFSACSDPDAEREIAKKQAEIDQLKQQIGRAKASLDSARTVESELRNELDSLDMSR